MFLYISLTPQAVMQKAFQANAGFRVGSVSVTLDVLLKGKAEKASYVVDLNGDDSITLRVVGSSPDSNLGANRAFYVEGSRFIAYDATAGEVIRRPTAGPGSPYEKLTAVLGALPDPVRIVCDPKVFQGFWTLQLRNGSFRASADGHRLYRVSDRPAKGSKTQLTFDSTGRVASFSTITGASHYRWKLSYSKTPHPFAVPKDLAPVRAFSAAPQPPHFMGAAARRMTRAMLKAEGALAPSVIDVKRPGSRSVLYWSDGRLREDDPNHSWAFDGHTLSVKVSGRYYQGKATHADALDYLAALTQGEDALARALLARDRPFGDFFTPDATIRLAGKIKLGKGQADDILAVKSKAYRASLYIRPGDNLVTGIDFDALGPRGIVLYHDQVLYGYRGLRPSQAGVFALRPKPGQKTLVLPKSAIRLHSSD